MLARVVHRSHLGRVLLGQCVHQLSVDRVAGHQHRRRRGADVVLGNKSVQHLPRGVLLHVDHRHGLTVFAERGHLHRVVHMRGKVRPVA